MAKYINKHANGRFNLRPTRKIITDGIPVDVSPITMEFRNHQVDTDNMIEGELAEKLMDSWMVRHPRQTMIRKAPSEEKIKAIEKVEKSVERAKQKAVKDVLVKYEDSKELLEEKASFDAFVTKAKEQKLVQGMRGTGQ